MTDRPDEPTTGTGDRGETGDAEDATLIAALTGAFDHRAGGPFAGTAPGTGTGTGDARFAAIEAAVRKGPDRRRPMLLGIAAAALIVLVLATVALRRSSGDTEVHSVAGDPTTTAPAEPVPGTGTTLVGSDPEGTSVAPPEPPTTPTSASSVPDTVSPPSIEAVDLRNFTYPTSRCGPPFGPSDSVAPDSYTLVDGRARVPFTVDGAPEGQFATFMELLGVAYGDATSDGVADAIVRLRCGFEPSDSPVDVVAVVSMVDGTPKVIGGRSSSGFPWESVIETPDGPVPTPTMDLLLDAGAAAGHLVVRWNQAYSPMGLEQAEHRQVTVTYQWDGTTFVPLAESDVDIIGPFSDPVDQLIPVESFAFASMQLPLDLETHGTLDRVACGHVFRGTAPVDARLVDGAATVRDAAGREIGTVAIERVDVANLDRDEPIEAMLRIRCTRGSWSVSTLAIFEPTAHAPFLLWSTTALADVYDNVIGVEVGEPDGCLLTITYTPSPPSTGTAWMSYRRGANTYIPLAGRCDEG